MCVCVLQVTLAYESIVLCMCSGKYNDIYFYTKITFSNINAIITFDLRRVFVGSIGSDCNPIRTVI